MPFTTPPTNAPAGHFQTTYKQYMGGPNYTGPIVLDWTHGRRNRACCRCTHTHTHTHSHAHTHVEHEFTMAAKADILYNIKLRN